MHTHIYDDGEASPIVGRVHARHVSSVKNDRYSNASSMRNIDYRSPC
jgi:hypothetical protein